MNNMYLDLLTNASKTISTIGDNKKKKDKKIFIEDDNDEILLLLERHLKFNKQTDKKGVIVNKKNFEEWKTDALNDMVNGLINTLAAVVRYRRGEPLIVKDDINVRYHYKK